MAVMWSVATLVAVQVTLIGWSVLQRPATDTGAAPQAAAGHQGHQQATAFSPAQAPASPGGVLGRYAPPPPPGTNANAGGASGLSRGPDPASPPTFVLPPGRFIDDPAVLETLDTGIRLRGEGDMMGALAALRLADGLQPDHPAILHEFALTYRQMGLEEKAGEFIDRILAMGDAGAGDYFAVWDMWSRGTPMPGFDGSRGPGPARALQLGRIEALRDPAVTQGEKIVLRIPIEADPLASIDPFGVEVFVFFYDLVDGQRVEQTTADEPTYLFITSPVDWSSPDYSETLEVVYFHPQLTPDQIRELGQRRFYGYVVKLFYQDELQDQVADPGSLADQRPLDLPATGEGPASPLFPASP